MATVMPAWSFSWIVWTSKSSCRTIKCFYLNFFLLSWSWPKTIKRTIKNRKHKYIRLHFFARSSIFDTCCWMQRVWDTRSVKLVFSSSAERCCPTSTTGGKIKYYDLNIGMDKISRLLKSGVWSGTGYRVLRSEYVLLRDWTRIQL